MKTNHMNTHIIKNSFVPKGINLGLSTKSIFNNSSQSISTRSSSGSIPLSYHKASPSTSSDVMPPISQCIQILEEGETINATGQVDDSVSMSVTGQAAVTSPSGDLHSFELELDGLSPGLYCLQVTHHNIDIDDNDSTIQGSVSCNPVQIIPADNDSISDSCLVTCPCSGETGVAVPSSSSTRAFNSGILQTTEFTSSSAGRGVNRLINDQYMYWSCNFASFRGLGQMPLGMLEIIGYEFDDKILSPAGLALNHPLTAAILAESSEAAALGESKAIVANEAFRLFIGNQYTNYVCDGSGISAFGVGSSIAKTQRPQFVHNISLDDGDNLGTLDTATYLRILSQDASAIFFSIETADLVGYISPEGYIVDSMEQIQQQLLAVVRDEDTGIIRQIWNYWDGLADIVPSPEGEVGYSIAFYPPSQVASLDEESGLFPTTGEATKTFEVTGDLTEQRISITEHDNTLPAVVPPFITSWTLGTDGAWSMIKGEGSDAIIEKHLKEELPPTDEGDESYRIVKTLSKVNEAGDEEIASCSASIYVVSHTGKHVIEEISGYGSDIAESTTYEYDSYTGYRINKVLPNGAEYTYSYDSRGRSIGSNAPFAGGKVLTTQISYVDDGSEFAESISQEIISYVGSDNKFYDKTTKTYSYSKNDSVKRVEVLTTAGGSSDSQLTITETWLGDALNIYARGRTRMTQAVNGVQTYYEYEATAQHGASYTVTTETRVGGEVVLGQSTRNVSYITAEGNTVRDEKYVLLDDGSWALTQGVSYSYNIINQLVLTEYDNGRSVSQGLICTGDKLWEIDENGIRTDYAYDTARTLIETTRSETATTPETITEWTKDAAGRTLTTKQFVGAMETSSSTEYDALGRTISQTDTLGRVTSTSYSEDGLTVTTTSPSGATFINRNNTDGSVAEQSGTGQRHLTYTYDISGNNLRQIVRLAEDNTILSQQVSNGFGQVLTMGAATTQSDYHIYTRSTYNALGQKTQEQTGDMAPTLTSYDSFGNPIKQVVVIDSSNPDSVTANRVTEQSTSFESLENSIYQVSTSTRYNAEGTALTSTQKQLISKLSETIESHSINIDERGLTSESQTCYGDTLMERLQTSTVPTSDSVATATIVDGFTTAQTDQLGGSYSFTRQYTATGITSTVTDPRGNTVTQKTDIAGRAIEQIDAAGNSAHTTYCDCCDNPASITDALGNVITYSYDVRGRKVAENGTGIYPATYSYDDADRMISHSTFRDDQADTTSYSYDAATGFLLSTTYPDGTAETRLYNTMNLLGHLYNARGADCIHTYNTLTGDLLKQNYTDDTPDITYTYNHLGQVTSITDAAGTRAFAYNEYSQMESDTSAIDTTNIQVAESYDEMGRSAGYSFIKGSENVQIVAQGYDSKGRIGSASFIHSGASKEFTYNYIEGTALLESLVHPNGITTTNTYEANRNLITDINDARSTTSVVERGYTYDELGRPITRRIARKGTVRNDSFSYDTKSQLTTATMGSDDYAYDYDNIGNRKTAQEVADEITYDANACNQYTDISDFSPEFDLDGNQTKLQTATGIWNVSYNAANRPTTFTSEDGNTVIECAYDYMGRRVTKKVTVNGSVTLNQRYLYRGYLQVAAIDLTRTALSTLYMLTWNPAEPTATRPLALQISGTWFTYGLDLSKNVTELFTTAGGVETCYTYSPFGSVTQDGDTTSPIQWSSEFYDSELALVYYNYRHYNPADGRWINRDPIGIKGGLNLYGFVGNRVWVWDVLGRSFLDELVGGAIILLSNIDSESRKLYGIYQNNDISGYSLSPSDAHPAGWYVGLIYDVDDLFNGLSGRIWSHIENELNIPNKIKQQISIRIADTVSESGKKRGNGSDVYPTINSYKFGDVIWALGDGVLATVTQYEYEWCKNTTTDVKWNGSASYYYFDIFEDPYNLKFDTSEPYAYHHTWSGKELSDSFSL